MFVGAVPQSRENRSEVNAQLDSLLRTLRVQNACRTPLQRRDARELLHVRLVVVQEVAAQLRRVAQELHDSVHEARVAEVHESRSARSLRVKTEIYRKYSHVAS